MLQLVHPELHGFTDAVLNEKGEPIKIVCDVLEVLQYVIDSQTSPAASLSVTFARVDPTNKFQKAGPYTQHLILGLELIEVLQAPGGITIDTIEASVLKTGIPNSYIRPEDLMPYQGEKPSGVSWTERMIEDTKRRMEAAKQAAQPPPMPMMPPLIQEDVSRSTMPEGMGEQKHE